MFRVILSVLSAFIGIRSKEAMQLDIKNFSSFVPYLVAGIVLAILFVVIICIIVSFAI